MLQALGATLLSLSLPAFADTVAPVIDPDAALAALERDAGGRLGVFALDTGSGRTISLRPDEAFGLCSTFKLPLAAAVLREADAGRLSLDTVIRYTKDDMVAHAPVTQAHLAEGGMTIGALAEAAQTTSDNVAANLLMRQLGGPERVTALFRELGDPRTRVDRYEPKMNFVPAGEARDTTTPRAFATGVANYVLGERLGKASREEGVARGPEELDDRHRDRQAPPACRVAAGLDRRRQDRHRVQRRHAEQAQRRRGDLAARPRAGDRRRLPGSPRRIRHDAAGRRRGAGAGGTHRRSVGAGPCRGAERRFDAVGSGALSDAGRRLRARRQPASGSAGISSAARQCQRACARVQSATVASAAASRSLCTRSQRRVVESYDRV
jgi:beta-lactamase class A